MEGVLGNDAKKELNFCSKKKIKKNNIKKEKEIIKQKTQKKVNTCKSGINKYFAQ